MAEFCWGGKASPVSEQLGQRSIRLHDGDVAAASANVRGRPLDEQVALNSPCDAIDVAADEHLDAVVAFVAHAEFV